MHDTLWQISWWTWLVPCIGPCGVQFFSHKHQRCTRLYFLFPTSITAPQDAHMKPVLQVYPGPNTTSVGKRPLAPQTIFHCLQSLESCCCEHAARNTVSSPDQIFTSLHPVALLKKGLNGEHFAKTNKNLGMWWVDIRQSGVIWQDVNTYTLWLGPVSLVNVFRPLIFNKAAGHMQNWCEMRLLETRLSLFPGEAKFL